MSESHVRTMQALGVDPRDKINQNSQQFLSDFVKLLRTSHGEKKVDANHFYQEYIRERHHMHQNATKWASLTEIVKHLGREGICRVEGKEEDDGRDGRGWMISWIDNSPESLRRQDALKKKERQDQGDEERELQAINEQIRRAKRDGIEEAEDDQEAAEEVNEIKRNGDEKIKLNFAVKKTDPEKPPSPPLTEKGESSGEEKDGSNVSEAADTQHLTNVASMAVPKPTIVSFGKPKMVKPKNVFAQKKNVFGGGKKTSLAAPQKPMSEAERIMKEELERRRQRGNSGSSDFKRQRVS